MGNQMALAKRDGANEGVASVGRALSVLTCFRQDDDRLSLAEIARRTGLVKSTILRLITSLEEAGLLIRVDDSYQLGSEIVRLHSIYNAAMGLDKIIMPVLRKLAEETQETAAFYTEQSGQRFCQFRVNSPLALRLDIAPGSFRPMDNASSAQILKMFKHWPDEQPPVPGLPLYTAGATTPHTASLSAPVLAHDQRLVGALTITGPISRFTWEAASRIHEPVMQAASQLCRALGGSLELVWPANGDQMKP
ncbi:IclR family transcriptional regulator [Sphingobium sp. CR28]|uniref:IclR family transcriptional regulator n=1 Tax=Sphingobium sp. CR28 TaxID=3400272 RepID=UPI003FEE8BCA